MGAAMNADLRIGRPAQLTPEELEMSRQAREAFYRTDKKPEHGCSCLVDAVEEVIFLRADDLVFQMEMDDPRDRWRHTGEPHPAPVASPKKTTAPYRTADSTIDAFWHVVGLNDPDQLDAWLDGHPRDKRFLSELLRSKSCR
jgi:hypothetical protein